MIRIVMQVITLALMAVWFGAEVSQMGAGVDAGRYVAAHTPEASTAVVIDALNPDEPVQDRRGLDPAAFAQTLSRPIFFPERRFPTIAVKPESATTGVILGPAVPQAQADMIKFHGVMIADGRKRVLLEGPSNGLVWVGLRDVFEGWTVAAIEANGVTLSAGAATTSIALYPKLP